jgi:SAM-dependent methyltransferase
MTRGPAGDFDYEAHGGGYAQQRRADPRIAALIHAALGDARTVVNVGAGAGSYEPIDRHVLAIEPSAKMRAQRPPSLAPAVNAVAEALPLDDRSVDAAMAILTVHQWRDVDRGLRELRRVARGPVVVLTFDGDVLHRFWLADYVPTIIEAERPRFPSMDAIRARIGARCEVSEVAIPIDCTDGFTEAFYARPERFLDNAVRGAQSVWRFLPPGDEARAIERLAADLASGAWDALHGTFRTQPTFKGSLRLLVGWP